MGAEPGREPAGLPRLRGQFFRACKKTNRAARLLGQKKKLLIGFEMLAQGTLACTGSILVGLAAPTWASLQALLSGDPGRQGSWLRYWLVFAIAELFTLPIPYLKLASPVLFCLYLSKLALLIWCQLPIENNGSELIFGQVFFLREEFAKASCSFMDDADYDEGEKITVKYSLQRKFKIFLLREDEAL